MTVTAGWLIPLCLAVACMLLGAAMLRPAPVRGLAAVAIALGALAAILVLSTLAAAG